MLENAAECKEKNKIHHACVILNRCYKRCDGERRPKDFIQGDATWDLAEMIMDLMCSLDCKGCQ